MDHYRIRWAFFVSGYLVLKNIHATLKKFGSNIIFSNGLLDPWSGGSVLQNISGSVVSLVTKEGAVFIVCLVITCNFWSSVIILLMLVMIVVDLMIEIFPYSMFYMFFEQYLNIWKTTLVNLAIAIAEKKFKHCSAAYQSLCDKLAMD